MSIVKLPTTTYVPKIVPVDWTLKFFNFSYLLTNKLLRLMKEQLLLIYNKK